MNVPPFGRFGPVVTAMLTPMRSDGSLNLAEAARLARWLLEHGSSALVLAGTTGEGPTLRDEEKLELFRAVAAAVARRAPVIANTGGNDTRHSIELSKAAAQTGVDALMLIGPYYNKPPQAGMVRHFIGVADATDLPLMIYNIPGRTCVNILPDTIVSLAAHPRIVALKESSGDISQIAEIAARVPQGFDVYSGDDYITLPALAIGARGVVSVVSHVAGPAIHDMLQAFSRGDHSNAAAMHHSLLPLFRALFAVASPIPVKAAMQSFGFATGACRSPLCDLTHEQSKALQAVIAPWLPRPAVANAG
ncbi:MAG: 4-hydroxy-tetrahydrodipicolinate synthase [Candidatus Eremiobacteraeota bacterium]|nr:4-hydroxy-tetrahydrodipicolinate synthase [Candidatus Eremiobacteraeota bacterium]